MNQPRCNIKGLQRPGIIQSFIQPTKMDFQNRATRRTNIRFSPDGKTSVGGVQWSAQVMQRPGLAAPVMVAKGAPAGVKAEVKPEQAAADMAKAAAKAAGFGGSYRYYR